MWLVVSVLVVLTVVCHMSLTHEDGYLHGVRQRWRKRAGSSSSTSSGISSAEPVGVDTPQPTTSVEHGEVSESPSLAAETAGAVAAVAAPEPAVQVPLPVLVVESPPSTPAPALRVTPQEHREIGLKRLQALTSDIKTPATCEAIRTFCEAYMALRADYDIRQADLERCFKVSVPSLLQQLQFYVKFRECVGDPKAYFKDAPRVALQPVAG
jgi:hypothetical protein